MAHKGKQQRSWPQLPPDIVYSIASHAIDVLYQTIDVPESWRGPALYEARRVYAHVRVAAEFEKILRVCLPWHDALANHTFWRNMSTHLDPHGQLERYRVMHAPVSHGSSAQQPVRFHSAYRHYKNVYALSCIVCRINRASTLYGVGQAARRQIWNNELGQVPLCKDHRKAAFCSNCLREPYPFTTETQRLEAYAMSLAANDDYDKFPYLVTTCKPCRSQALWRELRKTPADVAACGGGPPRWDADDLEARQTIEWFVDSGEGTVDDVVNLVREKHWLIEHTRVNELLGETVATQRYLERLEDAEAGAMDEDELDEDELEDLVQPEHFTQARDMAATDWARTRILDGHWLSPGDEFWGAPYTPQPAEHPAPWTLGDAAADDPSRAHVRARRPPTLRLAQTLYACYQRQLAEILKPALHNVAARIECSTADPAAVATRMDVDDVLRELQQAYPWSKRLDRERLPPLALPPRRHACAGDSPASSSSADSTSPVLTVSTIATTPSPPPKSEPDADAPPSPPPPDPENMVHAIPYVPRTLATLPASSVTMVRNLWREASAPLYACACGICVRARGAHFDAAPAAPAPVVPSQPPVQVRLAPAARREEEEEDEEMDEFEESEWDSVYSDRGDEMALDAAPPPPPPPPAYRLQAPPPPAPVPNTVTASRKRTAAPAAESADALDGLRAAVGRRAGKGVAPDATPPPRAAALLPGETPPKRARLAGEADDFGPVRIAKRRSEDEGTPASPGPDAAKRAKVGGA